MASRNRGSALRRWLRRGLLVAGSAVLAVLLAVLGTFVTLQIKARQPVTLPSPTGHYAVGRVIDIWTDTARKDPFSPHGTSPRTLSVWIWYPARVPSGAKRAPYLPAIWQRAYQGDDFTNTFADAVTAHAWTDVPVADASQPFPVLAFMPGFGRIAADYTTFAENLASHGYVVFGINPTYISDAVVLGGNRVVTANPTLASEVDNESAAALRPVLDQVTEVEAADLRFVVDQAAELNRLGHGRFAGRLETSRVGYFGHSIGGSAATQACSQDPFCAGAANLDGDIYGPVVDSGIHKPYLYLGEDPAFSAPPLGELRGTIRGLPAGSVHLFTVRGAAHFNFSDVGVMYTLLARQLGAVGPIEGARALKIVNVYLVSFFSSVVGGQASTLLTQAHSPFPEVRTFRT